MYFCNSWTKTSAMYEISICFTWLGGSQKFKTAESLSIVGGI